MPRYRVEFTISAKKEFDKLPSQVQDKIVEAILFLAENPFSELLKIKKIKGTDGLYRLRTGDYRIVYEVQGARLLIVVVKIGHRKDVYRFF